MHEPARKKFRVIPKIIKFNGVFRWYNYAVSALCFFTPLAQAISHSTALAFSASLFLYWYIVDSLVRSRILPVHGLLGLIDSMFFLMSVTSLVVEIFGSVLRFSNSHFLGMALIIRSIVAFRHALSCETLARPRMKRLIVEASAIPSADTKGHAPNAQLQICYVTSRIIVVSNPIPDCVESRFLQLKYSSLLQSVSSFDSSLCSFNSASDIVHSLLAHLHSNPANVVSVTVRPGDSTSILTVCALLIRSGAIGTPPTAARALQFYASTCYEVPPDVSTLLPKSQLCQLKFFEKIMTTSNPSKQWLSDAANPSPQFVLKRLVLSQFDPETLRNFSLTIIEVSDTHSRMLVSDCTPSVTTGSLTYLLSHKPGTPDLVFVLENNEDNKIMFYVNLNFDLTRIVAMNSTYHYTANMDSVADHYSLLTRSISPQIEIVAVSPIDLDGQISTSFNSDRCQDLLRLPAPERSNTPPPASCRIV